MNKKILKYIEVIKEYEVTLVLTVRGTVSALTGVRPSVDHYF
jgi:hypothetical protein